MRIQFVLLALFCCIVLSPAPASAQTATQDINITANVTSYCTINGITNPAALNATIPVSLGVVTTTPIANTIANVACNNVADVVASSLSGGVTTGIAGPSGTTNIIDYTATAVFGGATSTLNTATDLTAVGTEIGSTGTTTGAASGNLVVTITPQTPSSPLATSAAYADTLRVTLTAQ
jgi:hypothetical protein